MRQMLKPSEITRLIRYLENYNDEVRIELSTSAGKAVFIKITETQTYMNKLGNRGKVMSKVTYYNCKRLGYMVSDSNDSKQQGKSKKDWAALAKMSPVKQEIKIQCGAR